MNLKSWKIAGLMLWGGAALMILGLVLSYPRLAPYVSAALNRDAIPTAPPLTFEVETSNREGAGTSVPVLLPFEDTDLPEDGSSGETPPTEGASEDETSDDGISSDDIPDDGASADVASDASASSEEAPDPTSVPVNPTPTPTPTSEATAFVEEEDEAKPTPTLADRKSTRLNSSHYS